MNLRHNPELIPLVEWWEKDGKSTVICLLAAAIAVGGWYGWKNHRAAVRASASEALVNSYTTEQIEQAVSKYSSEKVGGALKIRLAKSYYDDARYEEALAQYESLVGNAPDGFADIPVVGRAQCLEALGRYPEAQKAFDEFATTCTNGYLTLTAQLGAARCLCQAGDKKAALARIDALKAANGEDGIPKARIEAVEKLIKRFEAAAAK